jgi:hypothetical protein
MHIWLGFTLFPRDDIRSAKIDDLKLMLCMIKRVKVSPVQFMLDHWVKIFTKRKNGEIEYSSLVWRLATKLGLMDTALVARIPGEHPKIAAEHFFQGHMTKEIREDRPCIMIYRNKSCYLSQVSDYIPHLLCLWCHLLQLQRREQNLPTHYFWS